MRLPLLALLASLAAFTATGAPPAAAQMRSLPAPIDLGIRNIMHVAMVHGRYPSFCCPHYERCAVAGSLGQIQTLIRNFGQRTSTLSPPTDAMSLYRTLRAGHPIILAIRNSQFTGHVVVLTGMTWVDGANGPEALLHVNDPLRVIPSRLPFRALVPRWQAAIVVY
jgi:hypothetical protein